MNSEALATHVTHALEALKGQDIIVLDVRTQTTITDFMVIASGNSTRHVQSLADHVVEEAKKAGERPAGTEGREAGDWVLVDLGGVVVHVMMPSVRQTYDLEGFWGPMDRQAAGVG
jgi:ribosome-associated protein